MNTEHFLNRVMGNVFGSQTSPALPTEYFIGLSSSDPGTSVREPSTNGTGYARVSLKGKLSAPNGGSVNNMEALSFPESITNWGTMLYYVVYDAATGGNLLFYGPLSSSRTVEPNTVISIKANELVLTLSNPA